MVSKHFVINYYPYFAPSRTAPVVVCILFSLGFLVATFHAIRARAWIWSVMLLAILMEAVGFGARSASAWKPTARDIYIVQFCLVILAPVFMAGIIYVVFGRIVFHVVPAEARTTRLLWVPPRWLTPIFVFFDIFALFLQLIGAVVVSSTQVTDHDAVTKLHNGKRIALAGISLQIGAFGLFSIVAIRFHFTSRRFVAGLESRYRQVASNSRLITIDGSGDPHAYRPQWRQLLYAINFACIMILIRSIYREIEFGLGKTGYIEKHEWCQYVLDALPMFLLVICFNLVPPGRYVAMGWRQQTRKKTVSRSRDSRSSENCENHAMNLRV